MRSFLLMLFLALAMQTSCFAVTYYISPEGNDAFLGTSPGKAWKSAAKVNQSSFSAGDRILFEGGKTFEGPVKFGPSSQGKEEMPVEISSYPCDGREFATIAAGEGMGIDICDASWLKISNLKVVGAGSDVNESSGIQLLSTQPEGAGNVTIDHVEVSGFGKHGISIGAWKTNNGYHDVRITKCVSHDNLRTGIMTWGPWGAGIYAHSRLYVGYCEAYNMRGGSGITLSSVDGGVVERSLAHNNGEKFSGGAGIWAWDSNDILFQFNESYKNHTTNVDGDGFDLDGGVTNSVMQYNYSHDNDAAGFLLAQYPGAPQAMKNIIIRYNISENDCRRNGYGAIHVWNGETAERIHAVQVYQNTVYLGARLNAGQSAIAVMTPTRSVAVRNNLFFTADGNTLVNVASGQRGIIFQNNAYWPGNGPFRVVWFENDYSSMDSWLTAAGDQERLGKDIVAVHSDPMLQNPGGGGTLRRIDDLAAALTAYRLRPGSPLARRGLDLWNTFGIHPGQHGFFGTPLSQIPRPAIGAHVSASMM